MSNSDVDIQGDELEQGRSPELSSGDDSSESEVVYQRAIVAYGETFIGPLPPPETLAQYEEILPGSAERIMVLAESQAEHRQSLEETVKTTIEDDSRRETLGVWFGAIVSIFLIACGTFLVYYGHDWAGTTMIVSTIASVVGVFVYGTQTRRSERLESLRASELEPELSEKDT